MGHTHLNYSEANLYSECVQHFMKNEDTMSEKLVNEYIETHAPVNMSDAQKHKVLSVAIIALFSDDEIADFKRDAIHA